ncbi:MAG: TolC family protein [Armatimonadetes bacterium]|nr:TolC family protein [Armatimonadota bacterium]
MPGVIASTNGAGVPVPISRAYVLRALWWLYVAGAALTSLTTATAADDQVGVFVVGPAGDTLAPTGEQLSLGPQHGDPSTGTEQPAWTLDLLAPETSPTTSGSRDAPSTNLAIRQITPEQAAQIAVRESLQLDLNTATIQQAEADLLRALGLDDVTLSAGMTLGRTGPSTSTVYTKPDGTTGVRESDNTITTQRLSLSKTLSIGRQLERQRKVARRSLDQARLSRDVVSRALDLTARELAYEVLRTEQIIRVAVDQANALAEHLAVSKDLLEVGSVARFEVVQAETELARAQGDVIAARTDYERALASLRRLLVMPQDQPLMVIPGEEPPLPQGDENALVKIALERRPEALEAAAAVEVATARLQLAFTSRNVSVGVSGSMSRDEIGLSTSDWQWQIAVSATKPIFDGRQEESEVLGARARLDAAQVSLREVQEDIALDVRDASILLQDARERLRVARQGLIEARERYEIARVRYETGYALGIEVLDAQASLTRADADVVNAQYNLQVATVRLRSAVGLWGQQTE